MSDQALGWDHVSDGKTAPEKLKEGQVYEFEIVQVVKDYYDAGNPPCNTITFHVMVNGVKIWDTYYCTKQNEHKINRVLKNLGAWKDGSGWGEMTDLAVGVKGSCEIYLHTSTKLDESGNPYINERIKQYKVQDGAPKQEPAVAKDADW